MSRKRGNRREKIVAAAWHPGSANAISPVIQRLATEREIEIVTIGHQFAEEIFHSQRIDYATIATFGLTDISPDSMSQLLRRESPNLILVGTSVQDNKNRNVLEQTMTLAATKLGIKSLAVLDFWSNYTKRFSDIFYTTGNLRFLPNKIAIMDEFAKQDMLAEGFPRKSLVVTGNPHFDNLSEKARNFTESRKQAIRKKIGITTELLFYAGNIFKKEKKEFGFWDLDNIRLINAAISSLSEETRKRVGVAIKGHPRLPTADLAEIKQFIRSNAADTIKLVENIDTQELILASDLTLVATSSVGIEATLMGIPCISLQPGLKGESSLILSRKCIIPTGYTADSCKFLLTKAVLDLNYTDTLLKMASGFRTDGKATERVIKLIYTMLEQ